MFRSKQSALLVAGALFVALLLATAPFVHAEDHDDEHEHDDHDDHSEIIVQPLAKFAAFFTHYCEHDCPSMSETHLVEADIDHIIDLVNATAGGIASGACWTANTSLAQVGDMVTSLNNVTAIVAAPHILMAGIYGGMMCPDPSMNATEAFLDLEALSTNGDSALERATSAVYELLGLETLKNIQTTHDDHDHDGDDDHDDDDHDEEDEDHDDEDEHDDEEPHAGHDHAKYCTPVHDLVETALTYNSTEEQVEFIAIAAVTMVLTGECFLPERGNTSVFALYLLEHFQSENGFITEDGFVQLYTTLGLIEDSHDDHGHDHSRRRRAATAIACYQPHELAALFGYNFPLSQTEFEEVAIGIVAMIEADACAPSSDAAASTASQSERWGYSILAAILTSAVSFSGALLLVCSAKKTVYKTDDDVAKEVHNTVHAFNKDVLIFLMALAIGALFGDAILHLIPHSFGIHEHDEAGAHDHSDEEGDPYEYLYKGIVVLVGFYAFYMLEVCIAKVTGGDHHEHHYGRHHNDSPHHDHAEMIEMKKSMNEPLSATSLDDEDPELAVVNRHSEPPRARKSVSAMILLGDAVHNFADGLAIAASFSVSTTLGLSTTIAIICHEIPHEIGDFVVLLDSGMKPVRALMYNFFSSLTCLLGVFIGLAATNAEDSAPWFLSLAAGLFIYIAVADIAPHVLQHAIVAPSFLRAVVTLSLGLWAGFGILIILARYEEEISV